METHHAIMSTDVRVRGSVIIVDDDEPTCQLLADCVRILGFDVQIATSAMQALAMMRERPVNIAFCDIVMPGYDGVWLINRIRRDFPRTAVVVATGLAKIDPGVAMAPCVAAHVVKPFDFDDIAEAMSSAVSMRDELQ